MSIENNFATSPEGIKNATRLIENTAGGTAHSVNLSTQTTQTEHAFSVYVKPNGRNYIYMYVGGGPGQGTIIDIVNGTKGNNVGNAPNDTIIEPVGNGWFRCTILFNGIAGTPTPTIGLAYSSSSFTYTGDGTSGVLIYAAQCEAGSYATSYIPNHGESGGVTRAADSCSVTGVSDVIGQTEGTLFVEFEYNSLKDHYWAVATLMGSSTAELIELYGGPNSNNLAFAINDNGANQFLRSASLSFGKHKVAIAYAENNTAAYLDGSLIGSVDTSCTIPTLTQMAIGKFSYSSSQYFSLGDSVKQATLFNERLSNAELATLTTL